MISMTNVRYAIKNMKIKHKLLLSYLLLIFVPVTIVALLTYYKTSQIVEKQVIESTKQSFEQANKFLSYKLNNIRDVSSMLFMNKEVQAILNKPMETYPLREQIDDYNNLINIVGAAQNSREIYSIRMFVNHEGIFSRENVTIMRVRDYIDTPWFRKVIDSKGGVYCRPTYAYDYGSQRGVQNIVSCMRTIDSGGFSGKLLGAISIDILEDSFYEVIKQTDITQHGEAFLVDGEGNIISGMDKTKIGSNISSANYFKEIGDEEEGYRNMTVGGVLSIVCYKQIENTDWQLIALIPLEEILQPNKQIINVFTVLIVLVTGIAVLTAFLISNSITGRIRQLIVTMRRIEEEKWDSRITVDSADEIGELQQRFNHMTASMRRLIKEKYQEEVYKKNAELKALQAQINPHFLYNTLDMVNWMALKHKARDISWVVAGLAKFFKLSLNNGRDIVPIRDEVAHVKIYVDIQNKRFSNHIQTSFDISEDIYDCATVKIILQPIVENAILHGIQEKDIKRGHVSITGKLEDGLIVFTVEDDGVGMSRLTLDRLLSGHQSGCGSKNVNEKIKLYFGEEYGLSYSSEHGSGTKATITFPAFPYVRQEDGLESAGYLKQKGD
ncbi:sensor histidine kinase [Paenibacillus sp. MBLB4367]|uniref:cache domain-containing sensor histidine kinase n=1 Tax=Paenibacillus sp. MBLB4367 TaxID=3384767 RepID=UPI003907F758